MHHKTAVTQTMKFNNNKAKRKCSILIFTINIRLLLQHYGFQSVNKKVM